jgi:hypothetical protein
MDDTVASAGCLWEIESMSLLALRSRTLALSAAFVLAGLSTPGCYSEGGNMYSRDAYAYVSTSWQPKTITLKDTRTGQDFWSVDVPVGKKLVITFGEGTGTKDSYTPDMMSWAICNEGDDNPRMGNTLAVPGKQARRLDMTLRPTPELPDGMNAPKRPAKSSTAAASDR